MASAALLAVRGWGAAGPGQALHGAHAVVAAADAPDDAQLACREGRRGGHWGVER